MMFAACMSLCKGEIKRRVRALTVTAALLLAAAAAVLTAAGFGLSLLYVWLAGIYGTMPALAIIAGGCAVLGVIFLMVALLRPASRRQSVRETPAAAIPSAGRAVDEAIAAVQQGSRESMLAALALALVAGVTLGRKL